ncbi:MAG: YggT family protein [Calditrichaeota bacterium]|nr:MAG: YggT family protein [Calditrichota bacterium]
MFLIGNFLESVAVVLDSVIEIYIWIIIIRSLLTWVNPDPNNPIVTFLASITDPVMFRVRFYLDKYTGFGGGFGGIDISPIIVILLLIFAQNFVVKSIYGIALRLQ